MNGIDRRGQKVRCIAEFEVLAGDGITPFPISVPQFDEIYTVADFIESGNLKVGNLITATVPGLALREMHCPACRHTGRVMGWPIMGFEPVIEGGGTVDIFEWLDIESTVREDA